MPEKIKPCVFVWDGEVMRPIQRFKALAKHQFESGAEYALRLASNRFVGPLNFYMACIGLVFNNLSEEHSPRFPTAEHLRKWALINTGHFEEADWVFDTPAKALTFAKALRKKSPYSVIRVSGCVVKDLEAISQSTTGPMDVPAFEKSKGDVLDLISPMANTTRQAVEDEVALTISRNAKVRGEEG